MARFVLNHLIASELRRSPLFTAALRVRADRVATGVRRYARDPDYRDSVRTLPLPGGRVRVGTDNSFAHLDEWGSVNNAPTGAMRRAVQAVGLRLERSER